MKLVKKSGCPDVVTLDRGEKIALNKTIELCNLIGEWQGDSVADAAVENLTEIKNCYAPDATAPKEGGEADAG